MKSITELTKETHGATRLLWHFDYWDGPLTGLMLWNGKKVWFKKFNERVEEEAWTKQEIKEWEDEYGPSDDTDDYIEYYNYRQFKVYQLTLEQLNSLEFNHYLFQKYVGAHTDYINNNREVGKLRPYSEHHKFYNDKKKRIDVPAINYSESNTIGEFEY